MQILALDISKTATGWAAGDGSEPPVTGVMGFKQADDAEMLAAFMRWVSDSIRIHQPQLVVIEAAFMAVNANASAQTAIMAFEMAGVAKATIAIRDRRWKTVRVETWRKAFLGKGRFPGGGKEAKDAALRMCGSMGWEVGGNHNRAEAAGIWSWGHLHTPGFNQGGVIRMLSGARVRVA